MIEGNDGTRYAQFEVVVSDYFTETISVSYATSDGTAVSGAAGSGADFESVAGTLTWNPGDAPSKIIQVPIHGDLEAELNESFAMSLSDASSGIIQRVLARGVILTDDAFTVNLDAAGETSQVSVSLDGNSRRRSRSLANLRCR